MTCRKCGGALPEAAPTGRPRIYCSTVCRRLAEIEIARLSRILEDLETARIRAEFETSGLDLCDVMGRRREERLADASRAIVAVEARLRALLAGD